MSDRKHPASLAIRAGIEDTWEGEILPKIIPGYRRPRHGTQRVNPGKKENEENSGEASPSKFLRFTAGALKAALQEALPKARVEAPPEAKPPSRLAEPKVGAPPLAEPKAGALPAGKELREVARAAARDEAPTQEKDPPKKEAPLAEPRLMWLDIPNPAGEGPVFNP